MVATTYVPDRGDILWLDFTPHAGHEQGGHRPGLVVSPRSYNEQSSLAVFCPITSRVRNRPWEVPLPTTGVVTGVVLADQIRSLDWIVRDGQFAMKAPPQIMAEMESKLAPLLLPTLF